MTRGGGPAVQVDFLKLFTGWWRKAREDSEARYQARMKAERLERAEMERRNGGREA